MSATSLGPYRLDRELGAGGMGKVWRAEVVGRAPGLRVGTVVALKVVHPHLLRTPGFFKRFLREAEIGRAVVHENVVRTFDCDAIASGGAQQHFLVMEYVEGQTLRGFLGELGRVPEQLCRHIGREVAKGLAAIHAAGAVHRDLKPENVLITKEHVVKVMDLGVARLADEAVRLSQSGAFVGSVMYAAPEQFRGGDVDGRADLHALGVVLYELATAQHPYQASDFRQTMRRVLDETPRRCAELNPQLSPFLEEVVHALLAKEPDRRLAPAAELAAVLDEGEESDWWRERTRSIRAVTKRPPRRIRIPRETALHGRGAELARLSSLFERAKSGEGQVAVVEGEAGIGKSRLVDEFVGVLQGQGEDLHFLFGSYPPGGAATASGAFSTAYRDQFGAEGAGPWLAQTPVLVPAFDALLRGETTPAGVEPLTKDSLQTCFVHATRALGAQRPTIVLIDDLHFAPEEGRSLFAALAMAVPGHRVLLVGTTRPGLDEKWLANLDRVGAVRIPLPRLGPKDLVRLLADTLKSESVATELAGQIALKSDGNPFFVFEILRGLREGRFLTQRDDGTWVTTRVLADIRIPSSVRDLVQARVADLSEDERNALDVASCLGFEFDPALVAAALGVPRIPLFQRLAHVEKSHRLVRSAGRRFVFDHHQVQEALYGGLPEVLRDEYHAAIAAAIEVASGAASGEPAELDGALCVDLAEHFLKGGAGAKALRYLDPAFTHLEQGYLSDAAVRLAERALAVPGLLTGAARAAMLLRLVERLDFLGRRDQERVAIEQALALSREAADRKGEAAALRKLGNHLHELGREAEAREHLESSVALAQEIGDRSGEASAILGLGSVELRLGNHALATEHYERAQAMGRGRGDRRLQAAARANLGSLFAQSGRFAEARAYAEDALETCRQIGNRRGEAAAEGTLGFVAYQVGRYAEAREHNDRHVAVARAIGTRAGEALAASNLSSVLLLLGRIRDATAWCEHALVLARELGDQRRQSFCFVVLARAADEDGRHEQGEQAWRDSIALRDGIGFSTGAALCRVALAHHLARRGRTDEARTLLDAACAAARDVSDADVGCLALAQLASLPGGDVGAAEEALARNETRLGIDNRMRVRHELFRATRKQEHLAEAKRLLDEVVAANPESERATLTACVRLNREIAAAAAEAGL